jgi:hypothetical protein
LGGVNNNHPLGSALERFKVEVRPSGIARIAYQTNQRALGHPLSWFYQNFRQMSIAGLLLSLIMIQDDR